MSILRLCRLPRLLEQGPPTVPTMTHFIQPGHQHSSSNSLSSSQAGYSQAVTNRTGLPGPATQTTQNSHLYNTVIPDVNAIRANPTVSQSVSHILSSLKAGSRAEAIQGKATHKISGRFNATDTVIAMPELRWPMRAFMVLVAGNCLCLFYLFILFCVCGGVCV